MREALQRKTSNPLKDILAFQPKRLSLTWKDHQKTREETIDALLGMICNSPYFSGGLHFSKNVDATDGVLNAYFEKPHARLGLLIKFLQGRWGREMADRNTATIAGSEISVKSSEELYIQVDGEPAFQNAVRDVNFTCKKNAVTLTLLKPPY
jgi:diacylglycerol kinase family enzyme